MDDDEGCFLITNLITAPNEEPPYGPRSPVLSSKADLDSPNAHKLFSE